VVSGQWAVGASLPNEDDLVTELGVSRTVVRESIKVLQAKGLVEVRPKTGTRVRARRSWHLLDADVVGWLFAGIASAHGEDLGDLRELYEVRATIEAAAARLAAARRTEGQLAEIEASERRVEAAWAEPLARRAADLDFHAAVVDAADNSLLSHVNALIRVALEASGGLANGDDEAGRRGAALRANVARAIRSGDAESSESAMRALVEHDWESRWEEPDD
jgi:DNA-binding FadR family transcriptional regulator